jgi:hypothetical protein
MPSISIRIDDVDSQTPVSGLLSLHQCLEKIGGECELSIIPFRHGVTGRWLKSLLAFIEDKPRFTVSLHGHTHIKRTPVSEFLGLSWECQRELINEGLKLLSSSSRFVNKFVPPWNSYDENTLIACSDLGIEIIGTSFKNNISTPFEVKVECISADFLEFLRLPTFYDLFFNEWHSNLMFHTYDFQELHQAGTHPIHSIFKIIRQRKIQVTAYSHTSLERLYVSNIMRNIRKKLPNRLTPGCIKIGSRV